MFYLLHIIPNSFRQAFLFNLLKIYVFQTFYTFLLNASFIFALPSNSEGQTENCHTAHTGVGQIPLLRHPPTPMSSARGGGV